MGELEVERKKAEQAGETDKVQESGKRQKPDKMQEPDKIPAEETGQKFSLEEAFAQLEEVIARLETEEITLEESFQEYNKGMQLLQQCNTAIDQVEKKVLQINEDGGLDEF